MDELVIQTRDGDELTLEDATHPAWFLTLSVSEGGAGLQVIKLTRSDVEQLVDGLMDRLNAGC